MRGTAVGAPGSAAVPFFAHASAGPADGTARQAFPTVCWPIPAPSDIVAGMSGLQVIVVSADPERARALGDALRMAGHHVGTQPDPAQAGSDLQAPTVDAAVIDLTLAGLDRVQLGRSLSPAVPERRPESLEAVERRHIVATLLYTGGNKRRAAGLLGIARSTLIQKVRKYNIDVPGRGTR